MKTEIYHQELQCLNMRAELAQHFQQSAIVRDADIGYVTIEEVNHKVRPVVLRNAATIANLLFLQRLPKELYPNIVIGVPDRGRELATILGDQRDFPIGVTHRTENNYTGSSHPKAAYDKLNDVVKIFDIPSFTHPGKSYTHVIRGLRPGMNVLVADDFCATGQVTNHYMEGLKQLGIVPVFVYIVAKDFDWLQPPQIGYRVNRERRIPVFAVTRLTKIVGGTGGKVIATSEDINFNLS